MAGCPKGYYWDGEKCRKSITIRRKGIYGKGFLSEPQSQQYAKIREEEKKENPITVERQMAALNAVSHGKTKGIAHKDLEYAKKLTNSHPQGDPRCPEGYVWVRGFKDHYGRIVKSHCRKEKKTHRYEGEVKEW